MSVRIPLTIGEWVGSYLQGADPRALLQACRDRLRDAAPPGVWIHVIGNTAFEAQLAALDALARACPDRRTLLQRHPLFGVPYAVKDNIDIEGAPTTAACPAFEHVAPRSAGVVRRLQAGGAVWLGKTNLDQFATGLVGTRSPYGQPACAFSREHISGGSSSGSALAVALGHVPFALGTDTAGSGRIPAAFNQVVGLKPTPGRVGTSGVLPACRSIDCVCVFALTVDDAGHVLAQIEGPDADDPYSGFVAGPASFQYARLRIGFPSALRLGAGEAYREPYALARDHAAALGHALIPIDFEPLHRTADLLYGGPWVAERHAVVQNLLARDPLALDPAVRAVIGSATRFTATDLFRAQYALKALQRDTAAIWDRVDMLLVPTASSHPRFADVAADPLGANSALGTYTNFVNLLGWCALALPASPTAEGLPFGVTAIGPANHDAAIASFGRIWQQQFGLPLGATGKPLPAAHSADWPLHRPAVRATVAVAVVGAHLTGMPLNIQLRERGAILLEATTTSPSYRLYALPDTSPPKPGMIRTRDGGFPIAVEVWEIPTEHVGSLLALVQAPLGLGQIELADGRWVHGFLAEAHATARALDISRFGGWRAYVKSLSTASVAA